MKLGTAVLIALSVVFLALIALLVFKPGLTEAREARWEPVNQLVPDDTLVSATAASGPRLRKCREGYTNVFKVRATRQATCRLGIAAMEHWFDNDDCSIEDFSECYVRLGRDGTLWRCFTLREANRLNPHHIFCSSARDPRKWSNFVYRHDWS